MTTLAQASYQWANRPADERFSSLIDLHNAASAERDQSATAAIPLGKLALAESEIGDLILVGETGQRANFTNWSFGQLCGRAKAPASYVSTLPAKIAADCLNEGIRQNDGGDDLKLLFRKDAAAMKLRAVNSDQYARIWNRDITSRLLDLEERGPWQPAPAAFDGSRGLYLGDRDMFAFLVDNTRRIFERGPGGGLSRGFFVRNSEVGAARFEIMTFLYEYVCGNHRVWGASEVKEIKLRHVGNAEARAFEGFRVELLEYANRSAEDDEAKIARATAYELGGTKDEVIDRIFGLKIPALSLKLIRSAADLAEERVDWYGSPRSAWGMAGALTEIGRDMPHADGRTAVDRAAGAVMEIAF